MTEHSIDQFLDDLASGSPTPGGGSAAAIMGAMGAALVSMVCNVSFGKKGCEAAEPELRNILVKSEELRRRFPQQLKIGSVEKIRDLVNLQLPGIAIQAMPVAPRQIPYHAGFVYFELDRASELWRELKSSGGIAIHQSGEFPGLTLEFWAIRS